MKSLNLYVLEKKKFCNFIFFFEIIRSPKDREKKQKKSKDKKIEKDDGKTTKFESYDMIQLNPILEKKESGLES